MGIWRIGVKVRFEEVGIDQCRGTGVREVEAEEGLRTCRDGI